MTTQQSLINFSPLRYIENPSMVERIQYRFPRSRKKRINKKWTKLDSNCHFIPKPEVYILNNNTIIGHPVTIRTVKEIECGVRGK